MHKYVFPLDPGLVEYIFAPFFDYEHSPALSVEIDRTSTATVSLEIVWCYTKIIWTGGSPRGTAVMARCIAPFDAGGYDTLVAAFTLPQNAMVEFALINWSRKVIGGWSKPVAGTGVRQEVFLKIGHLLASGFSLRSIAKLLGLRPKSFAGVALRIFSPAPDLGVLALTWFGLRNSKAYELTAKLRAQLKPDWTPWIKGRSEWAEIVPQQGLLFGRDELLQLRTRKNVQGWKEHFAFLEEKARRFLEREPESDFGDYLPNQDLRFTRYRVTSTRAYHWDALVLAFVGLVNNDDRMLGHALRYLMCMIHTQNWADAAEHRIPSSTWNQRSFMEEMTTTSVAILLDWLGFALTPQAKSLARQALWTRGMAHVQRDLFHFDYMHSMNQGAVFCRALVLGGLVLEEAWPRSAKVADDAYQTMKGILQRYIKPDGGIGEGPGYLCQTLTATLWTVIAYSRARRLDWRSEVRDLFGAVESYVRVMAASEPGKCIPSGDCRLEWFSGDGIPILASVFPDSAYAGILMACLRTGWIHEVTGTLKGSGGMVGMVYGPSKVQPSHNIVPQSLWLADTGKFSRTTEIHGHNVRLWATVSVYGATHSHLDHGGLALEIDEIPVFVDRGMAEYWKADLIHQMRRSFAHNLLTPVLRDGNWADQSTLTNPCRSPPTAGEESLLRIPSQEVWPEQMTHYDRVIQEGDGEHSAFVVSDIGELRTSGRVAFHLHTPHAFVAKGIEAEADIGGVLCAVRFPWAQEVTVQRSIPDFAGRELFHICAVSDELEAFEIATTVIVRPRGSDRAAH
jgi:hypothetical protein